MVCGLCGEKVEAESDGFRSSLAFFFISTDTNLANLSCYKPIDYIKLNNFETFSRVELLHLAKVNNIMFAEKKRMTKKHDEISFF